MSIRKDLLFRRKNIVSESEIAKNFIYILHFIEFLVKIFFSFNNVHNYMGIKKKLVNKRPIIRSLVM